MGALLKPISSIACALAFAALAGHAVAQPYVVDTGAGTASSGLILDGDPQLLDWTHSWHAGLITLQQDTLVTGIEAWMSVGTTGEMTTAIYAATDGLPRSAPALYSATYELTKTSGVRGWYGVSGLSWTLAAGSYWVDEEPAHSSTFSGALWMAPPSPLSHYAESVRGDTWEYDPAGSQGPDQWALRITGAAVPEPDAWALMIIGFTLMGATLRGRRRSAAA